MMSWTRLCTVHSKMRPVVTDVTYSQKPRMPWLSSGVASVCLSLCRSQPWAVLKRLNRWRCCLGCGLAYLMGAQIPTRKGRDFFGEESSGPLWNTVNIWHKPKSFGRWQHRFGLSLLVLQQLVGWPGSIKFADISQHFPPTLYGTTTQAALLSSLSVLSLNVSGKGLQWISSAKKIKGYIRPTHTHTHRSV